jgi:hypothetical protein
MHLFRISVTFPIALSLVMTACLGDPWRSVHKQNTLADYRRYVNEYPDSHNRVKAEENITFLELKRDPTLRGYASFRAKFPSSALGETLRGELEPKAFSRARFAGTPAAYQEFMDLYPDGVFMDRAIGNKAYVEAGGLGNGGMQLGEFVKEHPGSDYTAEAIKSLRALELKTAKQFDRVRLTVRVSPETPEVSRVVSAFSDRAMRQFKAAGQTLVKVPELRRKGQIKDLPKARLVIEHKEAQASSKLTGGQFTRPGMVATTRVSLYAESGGEPVWQRVFRLRLDREKYFAGTSMLFNPSALPYWNSFFVPVASWPNRAALRKPMKFDKEIVAVDSAGDRAVTLFANGEFKLLELANSEVVFPLAEYSRPKDFTRWHGVKILGEKILIYGEDGIEIVGISKSRLKSVGALDRQSIGSIAAVVPHGDEILLASSRGLLLTDQNSKSAKRLLRRPIKGLDRVNKSLVFTDGASVYISSMALLAEQGVLEKIDLGYEFGPTRVIGFDDTAIVLGKADAVIINLANPSKPEIVSRLERKKIGKIEDAVAVNGRVFLIGDRGLQLLDIKLRNVVESVDIKPKERVARMGRFLITTGDESLQVVDTTPLTVTVGRSTRNQGAAAPEL